MALKSNVTDHKPIEVRRETVERAIEQLIALLDELDGDAEHEDDDGDVSLEGDAPHFVER
jgi:hypothetical protein